MEAGATKMIYVISAKLIEGFKVEIRFTTGEVKLVDLQPFLRGPVFDGIAQDKALFENFEVDPELGTIVWGNGADIDPEVLYGKYAPAWMSETSETKVTA